MNKIRTNWGWLNVINSPLLCTLCLCICCVLWCDLIRLLITAAYRRRQQEPLGLQDLVWAAQLPRQVAPVPGDQDLGARVWPGPCVSRHHSSNSCTLPVHYASGCPILPSLHIGIMKPVHFIPSPDRSQFWNFVQFWDCSNQSETSATKATEATLDHHPGTYRDH